MSLDKNIRENIDGKYLTIYADDFLEGIEFARQIKISQIQFVNMSNDILIDFINIEKLSEYLQVISFVGIWKNISNLNSIYSLKNIKKIYIQQKQRFTIDISKFPNIIHLGCEYWNGILFENALSLTSLVLVKFTNNNLQQLKKLKKLNILHIYCSKIKELKGIEYLPVEILYLARNKYLEDVLTIEQLPQLIKLTIEKCSNASIDAIHSNIMNRIDIQIIK